MRTLNLARRHANKPGAKPKRRWTEAQLNKRWQKLCEDIASLARERGAKDPFIFACESGLCITNGEPANGGDAVLFILPKPPVAVAAFDAGGW